jgi:hypothetical protein
VTWKPKMWKPIERLSPEPCVVLLYAAGGERLDEPDFGKDQQDLEYIQRMTVGYWDGKQLFYKDQTYALVPTHFMHLPPYGEAK